MGKTAPISQMRKTEAQEREIFCSKCHSWAEATKVWIPFPGGELQGPSRKVRGAKEVRQDNLQGGPSPVLLAEAPPGDGAPMGSSHLPANRPSAWPRGHPLSLFLSHCFGSKIAQD